jgi:hypothetical protein
MAFSGISTNDHFTASQVQEDISRILATLSPKETEFLDWLGDGDVFATSTKHEWFQDYMLPNYISNSTAIASATAATGIMVAGGLGQALTEGTLLELSEGGELLQVSSVVGPNSVLVNRAYGGTANGSLAAGGQLYVRAMAGIEGQDHNGSHVRRLGERKANTVGYFYIPVAASGTEQRVALYGNDGYSGAVAKGLVDVLHQLEKEVVRGKLNSTNSLGTTSATRTLKGLRDWISTINSTGTAVASFAANPHTYLGDMWDAMYQQGANVDTETWAIVAGRTLYRNISDLNDTKVEDSNTSELFKRRIRTYVGPFGSARVILSRVLAANELLIVPRERIKVVPLQGGSFMYEQLAKTGDNTKGQILGEYTLEVHHENAMARFQTA